MRSLLSALVASVAAGIDVPLEAFIRTRCSTGGFARETITAWDGELFASVPGEAQRSLFGLFGVNLGRCWLDEKRKLWRFTSRELEYYLNPISRQPLHSWVNPWTSEQHSVVHVANDPVQFALGKPGSVMAAERVKKGTLAFAQDIHLFYPNPLHGNASYAPYAPQKMYESTELFKWFVDEHEVLANATTEATSAHFAWTRTSQFLPWMKMGHRPGALVSTAVGARRAFDDLPTWLQTEVNERLQLFRHPPPCWEAKHVETSWTYFGEHFDAYLAGGRFPMPEPTSAQPKCNESMPFALPRL